MANDPTNIEPGQVEFPLPIHGSEGLDFTQEGEEGKAPAPGKKNGAEDEPLSLEEFNKRFGGAKVKLLIGGEEKIVSPDEAFRFQQKYAGLEKNIEREKQETARRLNEIERKVNSVEPPKVTEPAKQDPNDPGFFVDTRVKGFFDGEVTPKLTALEQKLNLLLSLQEPEMEDRNAKVAKTAIRKQYGVDPTDFDALKPKMREWVEQRLGRALTGQDVIGPGDYASAYTGLKLAGVTVVKEPEKQPERVVEQKRIVVMPDNTQRTPRLTPEESITQNNAVLNAVKNDRVADLLLQRGVRPQSSVEGE